MNNNNTFTGKVALVTGGTSGIGKATAIEFARTGAKTISHRHFSLESGSWNHLSGSSRKPHSRAIVACSLLRMLLTMKTDTSLSVPRSGHAYVELQQEIHEALRREHPEWVQANGDCPTCEIYESRLAELLRVPSWSEGRSAA